MASHALLLRLFLSPSFFSVHVALRYLTIYADNVGITYYLTRRLREMDIQELREVWGFICYLLVTRPSQSRALECFVIETTNRSTHIVMITLWFMQSALKDLALARHDTQSFHVCQRVLNHCHELVFGNSPPQSSSPYSSIAILSEPGSSRKKVRPHLGPALIGMGVLLAGAPGLPLLTEIMSEVAIQQGRIETDDEQVTSTDLQQISPRSHESVGLMLEDEDDSSGPTSSGLGPMDILQGHDLENVSGAGQDKRFPAHVAAQTMPTLLHIQGGRQRLSQDPLGQSDPPSPDRSSAPYKSTPSVSLTRHPSRSSAAEGLLHSYDQRIQTYILRSHYCRTEVQFMLHLEYISNRLLVIPRPARVSALRAELTALNHKLPTEICLPMWCSSADEDRSGLKAHHRIVRIPPGECVVLNSAENAPYVLLIEILNEDLDFDPSKRNNREVLKKVVMEGHGRRKGVRDTGLLNTSQNNDFTQKTPIPQASDTTFTNDNAEITEEAKMSLSMQVAPGTEEEVDLVEQLYGTDHSLRSRQIDLSDSIVLPPPLKNKDLDLAAWSRTSPSHNSPALEPSSRSPFLSVSPSALPASPSNSRPWHARPSSPTPSREEGPALSLEDYSERMRTAAIMLAQLNSTVARGLEASRAMVAQAEPSERQASTGDPNMVQGPIHPTLRSRSSETAASLGTVPYTQTRLQYSEAAAIRERIMNEMLALEKERMRRMKESEIMASLTTSTQGSNSAEDEGIIRRELDKADPSAVVFSESWAAKKSRIRQHSPYGHLANWDCISVIVKTGGDLRQEQLAVQLIKEFQTIWREENCQCWVRYFRILITGAASGLVETITDAVSIHSIKKAEYARRLARGSLGHVNLLNHFIATYGDSSSAKFLRAQRNFAKSLAGYSVVTYLLQIKDRHNGNILLDREGHLIHIDFGFMLSNSPGNIGFEAAPFKLPPEYIEVLGGPDAAPFLEFRKLFREGFEASRKHCDRILTLIELMQKDSTLPCFAAAGENTANQLRERFVPTLTHSLVGEHVDRLIDTSLGSTWTRLYDSYQYYSQSIL